MAWLRASVASEFYERKRRLALAIAVSSVAFLAAGLYVGFFVEVYGHPRIACDGTSAYVLHQAASTDDSDSSSRLILLDGSFRPRARYRLTGAARSILPEGSGVTAFVGNRYTVLREGETVRGAELGQDWPVLASLADPGQDQSWIFGWSKERVVARRRIRGIYSEEEVVAPSGGADRVAAGLWDSGGPIVAWRERDSSKVRVVRHDGRRFGPYAEFDIGGATRWDVAFPPGRALLVYYHRDDRAFSRMTFRLRCCPSCGLPPPPEKVSFEDPIFVIGRALTGIAAAVVHDRLMLVVTRQSAVQSAALSLDTFTPLPWGRLTPLGGEPLWQRLVGWFFPVLLLFFSFSLVFLGATLLRERGSFFLEGIRPEAGKDPATARILQRAMAWILDLMVHVPLLAVSAEVLNVVPEEGTFDPGDGRWWGLLGTSFGLHFLYHFAGEWAAGRTIGKWIIGIRVAEADGTRLSFRGALVRNLIRPLDAEFPVGIFLGTSIMMITGRRQRVGDLLARTVVLQDGHRPAS